MFNNNGSALDTRNSGNENDRPDTLSLVNNEPAKEPNQNFGKTSPDHNIKNEGSTQPPMPEEVTQDAKNAGACVCHEMEQVSRAEEYVAAIKENLNTSLAKKDKLANIQPEIDKLLAALAEKQAEAEELKDDIDNLDLERMELKEKLIAEMGV